MHVGAIALPRAGAAAVEADRAVPRGARRPARRGAQRSQAARRPRRRSLRKKKPREEVIDQEDSEQEDRKKSATEVGEPRRLTTSEDGPNYALVRQSTRPGALTVPDPGGRDVHGLEEGRDERVGLHHAAGVAAGGLVHGRAGDPGGQRGAGASAGSTWSLLGTTTAVGTSIRDSQGVEWCRPSAATAWATAHGLVLRHSLERPLGDVDVGRCRAPRRSTGWRGVRSATSTASAARPCRSPCRSGRAARGRWSGSGRSWRRGPGRRRGRGAGARRAARSPSPSSSRRRSGRRARAR